MSCEPFDMGKTIRHPDVVHARIESVLDQIAWLRKNLAAREDELRQLLGILREMRDTADRMSQKNWATRRRRDPRANRELLERVAQIYRDAERAPLQAIASEYGKSERTAARWAGYASEAGLLPDTEQGKRRTQRPRVNHEER